MKERSRTTEKKLGESSRSIPFLEMNNGKRDKKRHARRSETWHGTEEGTMRRRNNKHCVHRGNGMQLEGKKKRRMIETEIETKIETEKETEKWEKGEREREK